MKVENNRITSVPERAEIKNHTESPWKESFMMTTNSSYGEFKSKVRRTIAINTISNKKRTAILDCIKRIMYLNPKYPSAYKPKPTKASWTNQVFL